MGLQGLAQNEGPGSEFARALAEKLKAAGGGGVSRGPGEASLDFTGETARFSEQFEATALPSGQYPDLEHSQTIGISTGDPQVDVVRQGAALTEFGTEGGQSSWRRRLAPRHRDAVRRFFQTDENQR
ncbi:hypothetical protein [Engelhardtia mirabilis]|uniref:Uncharacterized protein n=1 Tax=Engelhardtia mirabilis TaxID=2528011 RepID=A0A518BIJ6_9BACT|nr:hypothetical protein Pla133_18740 [Planctomycetes bacterium Pla133]QDV01124.1 hypothetical protein Pla86_18730 [Planctomycetes bacterium Pla86]